MAHPRHPEQGARFELVRQSAETTKAQYQAQLYLEDLCYDCLITLSLEADAPQWDSVASIPADAASLPAWMVKHTNALLRQCLTQAKTKGSWPRRIRRWRNAPD